MPMMWRIGAARTAAFDAAAVRGGIGAERDAVSSRAAIPAMLIAAS